jgi:hypothetical protein
MGRRRRDVGQADSGPARRLRGTPMKLLTEQEVTQLIARAGGRYEGRMAYLLLFTDPVTKSTMGLRENQLTIGNVSRKIHAKRAQFKAAEKETLA